MGYIALFVGLFIEALFIYDLYCEKRELLTNLRAAERSIDLLFSEVHDVVVGKPLPVQQNRIKEAPGRPILSGAAARKAAEAMNAPYWSAEKKVPNSVIARKNAMAEPTEQDIKEMTALNTALYYDEKSKKEKSNG